MSEPTIKLTRQEEIAHFRASIIGTLVAQELDHGELSAQLEALSKKRFRPPKAKRARRYSVPTLQRWYYLFRHGGLEALKPKLRNDAGRGRVLDEDKRKLLTDIRSEFPSASVPLILRTLVQAGTLKDGEVSPQTVRRIYQTAGLKRLTRYSQDGDLQQERQRLRWVSPHVNALWHGDVCHAMRVETPTGEVAPALVHLLLDDHSRYIIRIEVRPFEREVDMLEVLANAVREYGRPDQLYLDNGATYSGSILPIVCQRLGIQLSHHRPYDSPAGGKRERLFRTMREQCTDHIRGATSLHDVYVRILAWREQYHNTPHSSLMGRTPLQVWRSGTQTYEHQQRPQVTEIQLRDAFILETTRRIRKDSTLQIDGKTYEVEAGWLAGKKVALVRSHLMREHMVVRFEDKTFPVHLADPHKNAARRRKPSKKPVVSSAASDFNPADVALDTMLGRTRQSKEEKPS
jgi:transposase InsO family protein